jgi:hypothetical protein
VKNGNIALGLGVLAIALLAASGKLGQLWKAIMNAGTQGPSGLPKDTGPAADPSAAGSFAPGSAPDTGPASDPSPAGSWASIPGIASGIASGAGSVLGNIRGKQGANNTTIYAGADPKLDDVFAKWPAGHQLEWNAFLTCFASTGSVDVCAQRGLVLSTEGRG